MDWFLYDRDLRLKRPFNLNLSSLLLTLSAVSRCVFKTLSKIYVGTFCKNSYLIKAMNYFRRKFHQRCLASPRYASECHAFIFFFFLSIWVFFHDHSRITGLQGKGEGISLTPHYHFHPLHRRLHISRAVIAESSPLHIASSRTRTGNLWFPRASR